MAIVNTLIGNTDTTVLTVPVGKRYAITTIMVCNTWTPNPADEYDGITNFDMHFVPNGQAKGNRNMVIRNLILPAGETFTFDSEKVILDEGDRVTFLGESPTNLSATVSYLEV